MVYFFSILMFFKISVAQTLFDESPISCKKNLADKKCAIVFLGNKSELWVGHLILAQRGEKGDVNDFLKYPQNFKNKIKKTNLNKIYNDSKGLLNLAGHLEFDKSKNQWIGHLEAQFEKDLNFIDKKSYNLGNIYETKN